MEIGGFKDGKGLLKALKELEEQKQRERDLILKLADYNPNEIEQEFYKGDKKYTDYATRNRNNKSNT